MKIQIKICIEKINNKLDEIKKLEEMAQKIEIFLCHLFFLTQQIRQQTTDNTGTLQLIKNIKHGSFPK